MRTSLVIPAYNEEKGLPLVIEEYLDFVDEIIVVDDGSNDGTSEAAKRYTSTKVKLYNHKVNSGKVAALRTGVKHSTGDIIIFTDADYTYPARFVPALISKMDEGADLVLGSRFQDPENIKRLNRIGNQIFSFLSSYISCIKVSDSQTGLRAFRREMFERLDVNAKGLEFETKMTVRAAKLGYRIAEVPIEYRERVGKSKLNPFKDGMKMFIALLSVASSETSLLVKMVMVPSFIFILIGLATGIVSIYEKISSGILTHEYYPILTAFLILIGVQLLSLGFVADYLTKKLDRIEERILK